jgi:hypothetical protein
MLPVTIPVVVLSETRSMFKNALYVPMKLLEADSELASVRAKV